MGSAAAIFHRRLDQSMLEAPSRTLAEARKWTQETYWPAPERKDSLTPSEREDVARELARYTGIDEGQIDRDALTITTNELRSTLLHDELSALLSIGDLTLKAAQVLSFALRAAIGDYLRVELGYRSSLTYTASGSAVESSFLRPPNVNHHKPDDWLWDIPEMTPEGIARLQEGHAPSNAPPWIQNALRENPDTRVFIAGGSVDAMVSCLGNAIMIDRLEPELARRYVNRSYVGGHSMYRGRPETRVALLDDLKRFVVGGASDHQFPHG